MPSPWIQALIGALPPGLFPRINRKAKYYVEPKLRFKRVERPDGAFESICMNCLLPVGTSPTKEALPTLEIKHVCKGGFERPGRVKSEEQGA